MSKRTNSRNNSQFWGCDDYPNCRGTKNIGERPPTTNQRPRGRPAWLDAVEANPPVPKCFDQLPSALSPSRATDFMQCPRKFYEKTITKRVIFQGSEASVKGKLVHHALEKIFDRVSTQRTPAKAVAYIRPYWEEIKTESENKAVSDLPGVSIRNMLEDAEELVRKWYQIEDPKAFDPWMREHWVEAKLKTTPMRGIIDRLDYLGDTKQGVPRVRIVDYKTGKPPKERYLDESLFPIYTYAAALEASTEVKVEVVQLLYIRHGRDATITREINQRTNQRSAKAFDDVWKEIVRASKAGRFPCKPGPLCDWCDAKAFCPGWA